MSGPGQSKMCEGFSAYLDWFGGGASEHQPGLKQTQLSGIDVRIETKCAIVRHSVICVLLATAPALSSWPLE